MVSKTNPKQHAKRRRIITAWTVIILASAALLAGIIRAEPTEIFLKGISICLACIGIG